MLPLIKPSLSGDMAILYKAKHYIFTGTSMASILAVIRTMMKERINSLLVWVLTGKSTYSKY